MRRLALLGLVLVAAILSCRDVTGPGGGRFARGLSWNAIFPPPLRDVGGTSSGVVDFNRVHVVLLHSDGTVALDTTIAFPSGADSLTVSLAVRLLSTAPASGEQMSLDLGYIDAAGDTVFKGGPISLTAAPPPVGGGTNPPVQVPVAYTGPGASATSVLISPRTVTVAAGAPFTFTAVAKDAGGNALSGTPVIWTSLDPTIATITAPAAGAGVALTLRGTARILAQLLTGATDTVQVTVTLPASQIVEPTSGSGDGQTGSVGAALAQPIVAKVEASDGVGVAGTTVTFAIANGGGSVSPPTAVSDANGLAQTTWTLGTGTGSQSVTAAAATLTGSQLTYTATATAGSATRLLIATQPASASAGASLSSVVVIAEDANGNVAASFTGAVTMALGTTTSGATLGGTLSVNAIAGVATFSTLTINKAFSGYTLIASGAGLTSATTNAFNIAVGPASTLLSAGGGGQTGTVGAPLPTPIAARVTDAGGNGVAGKTVTFATTDGSVSPTSAITDVNGLAVTTWTLGSTAGAQSMTATAAGLANSPLTITATGATVAATKLVFTSAPATTSGGAALAAVVVSAEDANGNTAATFTGAVTLALGNTTSGAALGGTTTVAAVAGVATFSTLTINKAFTGYTLVATATGPTSATSPAFDITTGPATTIASAGGNVQTGTISAALPTPIAVRVIDAGGNGVTGKTVTFATTDGSVAPTSAVTDVNGLAVTTWTLGATVGAQSMTASLAGVAGSPLTITATGTAILPGPAVSLSFSTQPSAAAAGVANAPAIVVQALDANGMLATSFTGAVTQALGATTSGAVLGGTVTVNAVAGVATFSTLTINKAFTGYTLVASATGLTAATSAAFNITTGAATTIASAGGNVQTGTVGVALPTPVAVRVTDAGGNGVTGKTVTFATTNGSVAPTSAVTDVNGLAVTTWTLGATVGSQSMTATSAGLAGSPLTITATAASATRVWTGATDNLWTTTTNWSPAGTPLPGDSVFIAVTSTPPTLSTNASVRALVIASGAPLTIAGGNTLTDNGALDATGAIVGSGTVVLAGTGTLTGSVNATFNVTGNYTLTGTVLIGGSVTISSGSLVLNGKAMTVSGDFCTAGTGTFTMTNPADNLIVGASAKFAGGSTTGLITNGTISLVGNFLMPGAASSFAPSGANTVAFVGTSAPQTVIVAAPGATAFQNFITTNGMGVAIGTTPITIQGNATIGAPVVATAALTINGTLVDPAAQLAAASLTLGNPLVPLNNTFAILSDVTFTGSAAALQAPLEVFGGVTIAAGNLAVNGQQLFVDGTFATTGTGTLTMTNAADSLLIVGQATFSGGAESGLLTNGTLGILQGLVASGPGQFAASGNHVTYLVGPPSIYEGCACTLAQLGQKAPPQSAATRRTSAAPAGRTKPSAAALATLRAAGKTVAAGAKARVAAMRAVRQALAAKWPSRAASVRAARAAGVAARSRRASPRTAAVSAAARAAAAAGAARAGTRLSATRPAGAAPLGAAPLGAPAVRSGAGFTIPSYSDSAVYVAFADTTGNQFANVRVTGFTDWQTFARTAGKMLVDTTGYVEGNGHLSIGDTLFVSVSGDIEPEAVELFGVLSDSGYFSPDTTIFSGASQTMPAYPVGECGDSYYCSLDYYNVVVNSPSLNVLAEDGNEIDVHGSLFIVNSGQLRIGTPEPPGVCDGCESDYMYVFGALETHGNGTLRMTDANSPYMEVNDSAYFAGGSTAGLLMQGEIDFYGNFRQAGAATAYVATSPHMSYFGTSSPITVTFANPGYSASHFGDVIFNNPSTVANSNIFLDGSLSGGGCSDYRCPYAIHAGTPGVQLTSKGASLNTFQFDGVTWDLQDGYAVSSMNAVDFENMDPTKNQFSVERTDTIPIAATLSNWTFGTRPNEGAYYVQVTQTDDGSHGVLTLSFTNVNLEGNYGGEIALNGAVILGWNDGGGDNTFSSAAKWIGAGLGVGGTSPPRTGMLNEDTSRSVTPLRALRF